MIKVSDSNTLSLNYSKVIIIALFLSILSLLLLKISWFIVLIPLLLIPLFLYGENALIFYSIISFLSLTSTISVELRTIVQTLFIFILFYLFIKEYGFSFYTYPKVPKQIVLLIFLIYLAMITSTMFSSYILLGIKEIVRLTIFLIIIYFFYGFLNKSNNIRLFLLALFFTGIIYFTNVFLNFAQNNFSIVELNINELLKVESSYINVNGIGSFFVIVTSVLLCYFFSFKERIKKLSIFFLVCIYSLGLIITNSRAAILSTAISSLVLIYFYNRKIFFSIIVTFIVLIPLLFVNPINKYIDIYFRVDRLTTGRNLIWEIVSNIVKDNSVFGAGPAATKFEMYRYMPFMLGSAAEKYISLHIDQIEFGHAHNFYLFFLTDLGIPGFITSLFLPYAFISLGLKTIKKFKNIHIEYYWLSMGITAAGIGLFIRGFFEWGNLISYGTLESDLPFWLIFIILIYLYQIPKAVIIKK